MTGTDTPRVLDRGPQAARVILVSVVVLVGALAQACGGGGDQVDDRVVEVGCGLCQFHMEGQSDCYWAVRIDGKELMVRGDALPSDAEHDAHGPEGMCSVTRSAVVSGTLYETYFLATKFELQAVDPTAVATPHEHRH